ncbi:MAG: Gfo/Idh/MocA family oxidoreductase [Chloroflexota bacterium]
MRIALLGAGRIGTLHAKILTATEGVSRVLVADPLPGRARQAADPVGALAVESMDEALDQAEAVVVASSTDTHADLVRGAIGRGLPTFCEKPLANDLASTLAVAADIEASGVPFQLGFQRRFDAGYSEARRLIGSGELGTVYAIRLAGHDPAPPPEAYIPVSGGLFRDFSIHDFDILRWMTGTEVAEVFAIGSVRGFEVFAKYGDVDTAVATLKTTDGVVVAMTVARHDPLGYDIRAEVFGSKDSVSVGLGPRTPIRSVEPGVPEPAERPWPDFLDRFGDAYRAELATFIRVARGEIDSPCTARDGVAALRIAEAATLSLHDHRPVALSEIPG